MHGIISVCMSVRQSETNKLQPVIFQKKTYNYNDHCRTSPKLLRIMLKNWCYKYVQKKEIWEMLHMCQYTSASRDLGHPLGMDTPRGSIHKACKIMKLHKFSWIMEPTPSPRQSARKSIEYKASQWFRSHFKEWMEIHQIPKHFCEYWQAHRPTPHQKPCTS